MKRQKKLLLEQKRNDLGFTQKQNTQKTNIVEITKNHTEVKEDNSSIQGLTTNLYFYEDWDNQWYPDPSN